VVRRRRGEHDDDVRIVYTHTHTYRAHLHRAAEKPHGVLVLLCWQSLWIWLVAILFRAIAVTVEQRSLQNPAFLAEAYLKNVESCYNTTTISCVC
jgi:hypothetical protein